MTFDTLFQWGPDMDSGASAGSGTIVIQGVTRGACGQDCDQQMLRRALKNPGEA